MPQYNFRLFLKPTIVGQAIIDRLSPEGADRQALARRWIELGYALEQAGFRMDGTTVFQGARPLAVETPVAVPVPPQWLHSPAAEAALREARVAEVAIPANASVATSTTSATAAPAFVETSALDTGKTPEATVVTPASPVAAAAPVSAARPSPALNEMAANLRSLSA